MSRPLRNLGQFICMSGADRFLLSRESVGIERTARLAVDTFAAP